ncbi:MAG: hypothetical protein ACO2PN_15480 [Pyrobaculum sp.]|jgi:hypothetical protein
MVYEDEYYDDEDYDEDEYYDDEDYEDEDEEVEIYHYVEGVERRGNVIDIKVSTVDICCPVVLSLSLDDVMDLMRELTKKLNKDEIKQLFTTLIDVATSK